MRRPVLIWRQFQDCAGNSESILRSPHPDVAEIVLETLAWNYHELIMAGSGEQAEAMSTQAVRDLKGKYIAVIEGAIPTGDGAYCTIGGRSAVDIAREVAGNAACDARRRRVRVGRRARAARPDRRARACRTSCPGAKVVNLGGCPHNSANTVAVLVHYLTFGEMPALDQYNRPLFAYGDLIHDQCERRAYFDAGLFVEAWGDEGHRKGYCLYKMGCKGPSATYNCPNVRWNDGTSWPVEAGHNCIACASPEFWANDEPVLRAAAERARVRRRHDRRDGRSRPSSAVPRLMAAHGVGKGVQARVLATAAAEHQGGAGAAGRRPQPTRRPQPASRRAASRRQPAARRRRAGRQVAVRRRSRRRRGGDGDADQD